MGVTPADWGNGLGGPAVGGDLHILPPKHSHTVNCNKAHYGIVSGDRARPGDQSVSALVGSVVIGPRGDSDDVPGVRTVGERDEGGRSRRHIMSTRQEDTVATIIT